ncbi:MAG TPA: hypothetical protein VHK88_11175 [Aquihabitans sp.]|jgi:uncharacterized protein with PIN domain|nr:hypothetical protein [Aquihabitans sp.]
MTSHPPSVPDLSGTTRRRCPSCPEELSFAATSSARHRRLFARCQGCGGAYTLYGGQVSSVAGTGPRDAIAV